MHMHTYILYTYTHTYIYIYIHTIHTYLYSKLLLQINRGATQPVIENAQTLTLNKHNSNMKLIKSLFTKTT